MESPVNPESIFDLPELPQGFLVSLREAASEAGIKRLAFVGGVVRDVLLQSIQKGKRRKLLDIDLVVEGSAEDLARSLKNRLGSKRVTEFRTYDSFQTAEMVIDGVSVDIASSREETYNEPGQNPEVSPGSIEKDLTRRDFTINAMAIDIFTTDLIDLHGGITALSEKKINFLHSRSVVDDPTRIIRAARYASRLKFELTDEAIHQVHEALNCWPWGWHHNQPPELAPPALATRLRMELEIIFEKESWVVALKNLQRWGALALLDQGLQRDKRWPRRLVWASRLNLSPLTALIAGAQAPLNLAIRLQLAKKQQRLIMKSLQLQKLLNSKTILESSLKWPPSEWCKILERNDIPPEAVALTASLGMRSWRPLFRWWARWRFIKASVSASMLIEQGWRPGPELGAEIERLRLEKIDNEINQRPVLFHTNTPY